LIGPWGGREEAREKAQPVKEMPQEDEEGDPDQVHQTPGPGHRGDPGSEGQYQENKKGKDAQQEKRTTRVLEAGQEERRQGKDVKRKKSRDQMDEVGKTRVNLDLPGPPPPVTEGLVAEGAQALPPVAENGGAGVVNQAVLGM